MFLSKFVQRIKCLSSQQNGSVAIIFAVTFAVVIVAGGMALDYARAISTQTDMQAAADAAVLAAVRAKANDGNLSNADLTTVARDYFDNNISGALDIQAFNLVPDGVGYRVDIAAKLATTMLSVSGRDHLDLNVASTASLGSQGPLELALVLDNTGSMSGSKLAALKDSAKQLVDTILDNNDANKPSKIALVPFGRYVNVGLANRNAPWLDVANDTQEDVWQGCVGSRNYPRNIEDDSYDLERVPGLMNTSCSNAITPLTADKAQVTAVIEAMSASGNTYIPSGLAWGWRAVSQSNPYNEGKNYTALKNDGGVKAIVLMTDGENTRAPNYPEHDSTNTDLANTLTAELCSNVKNEEILIYTIAFAVTDPTTKNMLRSCATKTSYYFDATDSSQLASAFDMIGTELSKLRLTD